MWLTALSTGYFLGSDCCSVAEVSFDYVISVYLFVRFKEVIRLYVQLVLGFKLSNTRHPQNQPMTGIEPVTYGLQNRCSAC